MPELSDRDRAILLFEEGWLPTSGSKESAIRERFDLSATRYYQVLNRLIDDPVAISSHPSVVKLLHGRRAARVAKRAARRV